MICIDDFNIFTLFVLDLGWKIKVSRGRAHNFIDDQRIQRCRIRFLACTHTTRAFVGFAVRSHFAFLTQCTYFARTAAVDIGFVLILFLIIAGRFGFAHPRLCIAAARFALVVFRAFRANIAPADARLTIGFDQAVLAQFTGGAFAAAVNRTLIAVEQVIAAMILAVQRKQAAIGAISRRGKLLVTPCQRRRFYHWRGRFKIRRVIHG